jgi:hypothetical protein
MYCNYQQNNWSKLLPLVEFAYNNAPNATTGISPFFANKGYHPNISIHLECDLTSAQARDFAVDLDELHKELRIQILDAQKHYQVQADQKRTLALDFPIGSQVFIKAQFFRTTRPSKKLSEKNLGPYNVIAKVGSHSYTICLPQFMKAVHLVFHVSQLEPATPNTIPNRIQPPPPTILVDREPEYEISEILDSKLDQRQRQCKLLYLVHWEGYQGTDEETSWILASELDHTSELISKFHSSYLNKPGPDY